MPVFYSDAESCNSAFFAGQSIWSSDGIDQHRNIQTGHANANAAAMQQLAYELSVFSLARQQQQQQQQHAFANETLDLDYKTAADTGTVMSPVAGLLPAAPGAEEEVEIESGLLVRRRSQNTTECVPVPSSEHVAEIVGRQGCKIKALRAKTNTYIKTPVRGDEPVFVVTGRRDDVEAAKREILSAADHFTQIRASRRHSQGVVPAPGHVTAYVRVPYKVVGLVVGPKGATIKRIQQQTHTYIITPSREKDPVFEVTGLPENVETARKEIETHIANRTGVYPATTIGTPQLHCSEECGDGSLSNDFHLNGVDATLSDSSTTTPDSTPANIGSLFSIETRRDSIVSGPPFTSAFARASSFSSCNPFALPTAALEQRRASADVYVLGNAFNVGDATRTSGAQAFGVWSAFRDAGASNKNEGLPAFASSYTTTAANPNKSLPYRLHLANSHSGSDQDEGVWSVGGESPNSLAAEPLASSCLGSIWSEVAGV